MITRGDWSLYVRRAALTDGKELILQRRLSAAFFTREFMLYRIQNCSSDRYVPQSRELGRQPMDFRVLDIEGHFPPG
jgi:hypothetical protein